MTTSTTLFRLTLAAAALAVAGSATAQMKSVGKLSEHGFPATITDFAGTALVHGLDVNDPLLIVEDPFFFDPLLPLDVDTGNFPPETLYWMAAADMPTTVGDAEISMSVAAVFGTDTAQQGQQTLSAALTIRIDTPTVGTYTVTHPSGVQVFEVAVAGDKAINETSETFGGGTSNFNSPLNVALSPIGPTLLEWDINAPLGYLGNPALPHTVTGSPFGTNFFRVEGPDVGGPGIDLIETDLFTVVGKRAVIAPTAWADLSGGLPGTDGIQPYLSGTGDLSGGSPFSVSLTGAPDGTLGILFVGTQASNTPFAGGVLVPNPSTGFRRQRITNFAGQISFGGAVPTLPPGVQIFIQYWIQDSGAPQSFTGTNAIVGTVP